MATSICEKIANHQGSSRGEADSESDLNFITPSNMPQEHPFRPYSRHLIYGNNYTFLRQNGLIDSVSDIEIFPLPRDNKATMLFRIGSKSSPSLTEIISESDRNSNTNDFQHIEASADFDDPSWVPLFVRQAGQNRSWFHMGVSETVTECRTRKPFRFPSTAFGRQYDYENTNSNNTAERMIKYLDLAKLSQNSLYLNSVKHHLDIELRKAYATESRVSIAKQLDHFAHPRNINAGRLICQLHDLVSVPLGLTTGFPRNLDSVANLSLGHNQFLARVGGRYHTKQGFQIGFYYSQVPIEGNRVCRPLEIQKIPPYIIALIADDTSRDVLRGIYIFPKQVLADRKIFASSACVGKMAMILYPGFLRKTPPPTQKWQSEYFIDLQTESPHEYLTRISQILEVHKSESIMA